jgi:hypothetical protein
MKISDNRVCSNQAMNHISFVEGNREETCVSAGRGDKSPHPALCAKVHQFDSFGCPNGDA